MKSPTIVFAATWILMCSFAVSSSAQNLRNRLPIPASHAPLAAADASARSQQTTAGVKSDADTCVYPFTNPGNNNSFMFFCVTLNGNLLSFQSPAGIEYLNLGALSEGYGICDQTPGGQVGYYDYSDYGISANWNPPVLVSLTAAAVKISRETSDLHWTLTQTITKLGGTSPYAKVTMVLKNNSAVAKDVLLHRWADVDPFNANATGDFKESFDATINSAWGYTSVGYVGPDVPGYGLMIQNVGVPTPTSIPAGWTGFDLMFNVPPGANPANGSIPDPCNPLATSGGGYITGVDGSVGVLYSFHLKANQAVTVNDRYLAQ